MFFADDGVHRRVASLPTALLPLLQDAFEKAVPADLRRAIAKDLDAGKHNIRAIFDQFDDNSDGFIDAEEFQARPTTFRSPP